MDDQMKARLINKTANDLLMQGDASIPKPREATDPDEIAKLRAEHLPKLIKYASDLVRLMKMPRPEYKSERNQLKRDRITAWQNLEDELEYYARPTRPYTLTEYAVGSNNDYIYQGIRSMVFGNDDNPLLRVEEVEDENKEEPNEH